MCHQNKYWAMWSNLKGCKSWDFFGRNDAKAETPVLWPTHAKSWLIGKDSDAGRDWGQEEKGHHQLDGHEFEWSLGVGDGQGGLACCNSWGCKESDTTEQLNWTELNTNTELISISPTHVFVMEPISSVSLFCLSINTHTHIFIYFKSADGTPFNGWDLSN